MFKSIKLKKNKFLHLQKGWLISNRKYTEGEALLGMWEESKQEKYQAGNLSNYATINNLQHKLNQRGLKQLEKSFKIGNQEYKFKAGK